MKRLEWKVGSIYLEIVLTLMQDRCRFAWNIPYAKKSIWMHPIELLDDMYHIESRLALFGYRGSFGAR